MAGKKKGKKVAGESGGGKAKKSPGGKAKKVKKKSEDAKTRQLEQRAAVEEQRRRLREELVNSFLRHKLQKELILTRQNQAKLTDKWRRLMRESKSAELSGQLQDIKSDFEKRAESNSRQINQLLAELDEHGRDFRSMTEAHLKTTQETYEDHQRRLSVLDAGFVEQRAGVEATVAADYARANEAHGREKAALSAAFQTLQGHYRQSYLEQRAQYQIRKDDLVNQGLEEQQSQRLALERRLEIMWRQAHETYNETVDLDERRRAIHASLQLNDQAAAAEIDALEQRLEQLTRAAGVVSRRVKTSQAETSAQLGQLEQHRAALHWRRERLRAKLRHHQRRCTEILQAVCASSSETIQHFEELAQKGNAILRCAQRCAVMKPMTTTAAAHLIGDDDDDSATVKETTGERPVFEHDHFGRFWTRFNAAYLETLILQRRLAAAALVQRRRDASATSAGAVDAAAAAALARLKLCGVPVTLTHPLPTRCPPLQ